MVPKGVRNVKNAFSTWISHINCPVSSFASSYLRQAFSVALVHWVHVSVLCVTCEDLSRESGSLSILPRSSLGKSVCICTTLGGCL